MNLTAQQVFDQIVAHLRTQGCKAIVGAACMYRGNNGTKCAAGCLIADEEYQYKMEGHPLIDILSMAPGFKAKYDQHYKLILEMQVTHDNYPINDWERLFASIASKYNVVYTSTTI